jgi:hypothetical protein
MSFPRRLLWLLPVLLLSACQKIAIELPRVSVPATTLLPIYSTLQASATPTPFSPPADQPTWTSVSTPPPGQDQTVTGSPGDVSHQEQQASLTPAPSLTPLPAALYLDPADWHTWPVTPILTEPMRLIYQLGQALGNDPHAFSVFGDCQQEPAVFMGVYETDPAEVASLPPSLQETLAWFTGSFGRDAPTVRPGTTTGALLWPTWHQNRYTCTTLESPLQCELRLHKPSFVLIQVGSHYESRNETYMRAILDELLAAGVVPILGTKADEREGDGSVNLGYARLAAEYSLPLWNFWAAVDGLPNRGLYTLTGLESQGDLYLTEAAQAIHRLTALQALDAAWRAVIAP